MWIKLLFSTWLIKIFNLLLFRKFHFQWVIVDLEMLKLFMLQRTKRKKNLIGSKYWFASKWTIATFFVSLKAQFFFALTSLWFLSFVITVLVNITAVLLKDRMISRLFKTLFCRVKLLPTNIQMFSSFGKKHWARFLEFLFPPLFYFFLTNLLSLQG